VQYLQQASVVVDVDALLTALEREAERAETVHARF